MELALEAGADDVTNDGDSFSLTGPPESFSAITKALEDAGIKSETAEVTSVPKSRVMLSAAHARTMIAIIEALEDHDDVQSAITNGDLPEEVLAELGSGS